MSLWASIITQFDSLGVDISDWNELVGGTLNSFFRMTQSLMALADWGI